MNLSCCFEKGFSFSDKTFSVLNLPWEHGLTGGESCFRSGLALHSPGIGVLSSASSVDVLVGSRD